MELTQKELSYEPSLREVYEKWQSQPNTAELWGEMSEEIRWAMALENFGIPKDDNLPNYGKQSPVISNDKYVECTCNPVKTASIIVISDDESDDEKHKCRRNLVKTVPLRQVIVISDDESDDESDGEKEKTKNI